MSLKRGDNPVPLIKLKQKGQLTLPAEIRRALKLGQGDLLEAEVEDGQIVLRPKVLLDRKEAVKHMRSVADQVAKRLEEEGLSQEDLQRLIDEEVRAVRNERLAAGQ